MVTLRLLANSRATRPSFVFTISITNLRAHLSSGRRHFSKSCRQLAVPSGDCPDVSRIRNIGIIAHIDAGKTTTTERMLYYSGYTRRLGNVDDGSTVTDFLPAERARGITIQSAAITFHWPPQDNNYQDMARHQINLIDTPGHADFTFEVRRSLRILDGAVCILDGVAGVEAQTEEVWKQAGKWQIPRIVYVNKLDRDGAAFGRTVREVGVRLGGWPAVCQIPWWEDGKGRFTGLGDVINLQGLLYEQGGDGKQLRRLSLLEFEKASPSLAAELRRARVALVELLSEHDDLMVEAFLEADEDHLAVTPAQVLQSLRRCLMAGSNSIIPVFAGSSFRNIGVQPLLDAVVNLLPSPQERPDAEISIGARSGSLQSLLRGEMSTENVTSTLQKGQKKHSSSVIINPKNLTGCALGFKVVSDPRKGVLVYVRVYSGSIKRGDTLYNTNLKVSEKTPTLLQAFAGDFVAVQSIEAGQIGVLAGSKFARTGDTLIVYAGNKASLPEPISQLQLRPIEVPPPVFFASVEPKSFREERDVHEKLGLLLREDPSLHVTQDQDTGQTLLSGMGELHLEIACDRLVSYLGANASMGKIAIGYRETLNAPSDAITKIYDKEKSETKGKAGCSASVEPMSDHTAPIPDMYDQAFFVRSQDGNIVVVTAPTLDEGGGPKTSDDAALPQHLSWEEVKNAYVNGALAALSRGPKHSYPMRNTKVTLMMDPSQHLFGNESTPSAMTSAARVATIAALKDASSKGGTTLMEPVMNVDITVDEANLGNVSQDISSSRGGQIVSLGDEDQISQGEAISIDPAKIYAPRDPYESDASSYQSSSNHSNLSRSIKAKVPLKEMVGYLKHLRSLTGGRGTFVMNVDRFVKMTSQREKMMLAEMQGSHT